MDGQYGHHCTHCEPGGDGSAKAGVLRSNSGAASGWWGLGPGPGVEVELGQSASTSLPAHSLIIFVVK